MYNKYRMTTQELTSTIDRLTEEERLAVSRYVDELLKNRNPEPVMPRYTKESFIAAILESHAQAARGEVRPWPEVRKELCDRYHLSI